MIKPFLLGDFNVEKKIKSSKHLSSKNYSYMKDLFWKARQADLHRANSNFTLESGLSGFYKLSATALKLHFLKLQSYERLKT